MRHSMAGWVALWLGGLALASVGATFLMLMLIESRVIALACAWLVLVPLLAYAATHITSRWRDLLTVDHDFVVEMGACRSAGFANVTDPLALHDTRSGSDAGHDRAQMKIVGDPPVVVLDGDHRSRIAVATTGDDHLAVTRRINRCSDGSRKVRPAVKTGIMLDRMETHSEP